MTWRGRLAALTAVVLALLLPMGAAFATQDPYLPQQWGLERIHAPDVWNVTDGTGIVVAVIDSGVDLAHPDLASHLARDADGRVIGVDFVDGDDEPADADGHGTMVAGIVAAVADNGAGVASVAPGARIMPIRVLDEQGRGSSLDVDAGIRWAVDHGADVINLSLEGVQPLPGSLLPEAPANAVRYAWEHGVVVVAAAGNSGSEFTDYPATSPVLLVGATDEEDRPAEFSDSGRQDAVMAPGVGIVSTWCRRKPDDPCDGSVHGYGIADGTSFAAPHVSGLVALLRALDVPHDRAVQVIRDTAGDLGDAGPDRATGYGLVNAAAAVAAVRPAPPPAPSPSESPSLSPPPPAPSPTASPTAEPTLDEGASPAPPADDRVPTPTPAPTIVASDPDPGPGDGGLRALASGLLAMTALVVGLGWRSTRPGRDAG